MARAAARRGPARWTDRTSGPARALCPACGGQRARAARGLGSAPTTAASSGWGCARKSCQRRRRDSDGWEASGDAARLSRPQAARPRRDARQLECLAPGRVTGGASGRRGAPEGRLGPPLSAVPPAPGAGSAAASPQSGRAAAAPAPEPAGSLQARWRAPQWLHRSAVEQAKTYAPQTQRRCTAPAPETTGPPSRRDARRARRDSRAVRRTTTRERARGMRSPAYAVKSAPRLRHVAAFGAAGL